MKPTHSTQLYYVEINVKFDFNNTQHVGRLSDDAEHYTIS